MKTTTLLGAMILAATFAGPAAAIFKCTTQKGVVYQDRPCREGSETDIQIVIPTGEIAPKDQVAQDDGRQSNPVRGEGRFGAPKTGRAPTDDSVSVTRPADKRANDAATGTRANETAASTSNDAQKKEARTTTADNSGASSTAEQARKADPSAKYYTTDAFSAGSETPAHMTCESATGEKRVFYLSNGKLTSI